MLCFSERTIDLAIDTDRCLECQTKACVEACWTYARGILQLVDGHPSVAHLDDEGVKRGGTECLACEYECHFRGRQAIFIQVPITGLPEYLAKRGLSKLDRSRDGGYKGYGASMGDDGREGSGGSAAAGTAKG